MMTVLQYFNSSELQKSDYILLLYESFQVRFFSVKSTVIKSVISYKLTDFNITAVKKQQAYRT